jgi:hypothetical protein
MFSGFGTIRQNVDQMVWGGFIYFDVYGYFFLPSEKGVF